MEFRDEKFGYFKVEIQNRNCSRYWCKYDFTVQPMKERIEIVDESLFYEFIEKLMNNDEFKDNVATFIDGGYKAFGGTIKLLKDETEKLDCVFHFKMNCNID